MKFKLKQMIYFCVDMKRMTHFYTEVMGLRPEENPTLPTDEWLRMEGDGFSLCLHKSGVPGNAPGMKNKLVFWVDDVAKARAYLIANKVKMGVHHHWGEMEASDGHDPEGNKFQVAGPAKSA